MTLDTLAAPASHEIEVKHSRFLARATAVTGAEEAMAWLQSVGVPDATHNCWAWRIGDDYRSSDDGEPAGTAGRPILAAIDGQGFDQVVVVVTRWYGGIKLGAGGLVRAYSKSAKLALEAAGVSQKRVWEKLVIPCPYNLFEQVKKEISAKGGMIIDTVFGTGVDIVAIFPAADTEQFVKRLTDLSSGRIETQSIGQEYRAFPIQG